MATRDEFRQAVRSVQAAALDEGAWPEALARICGLFGAVGGHLEGIDRRAMRLVEFHSHNLPAASEIAYAEEYLARNPRLRHGLGQRVGDIAFDYQHMDEADMRADPFYCEFLPQVGIRYYVAAVVASDEREFAAVAISRSARTGHAGQDEIALMRRIAPHLRHAHDVNSRLRRATIDLGIFEQALEQLADGVAILRADGTIVFANEAARAIAARGDGVRLSGGRIGFAPALASRRFETALEGVRLALGGGVDAPPRCDFSVPRSETAPPYLVSVRPILAGDGPKWSAIEGAALVFIRDPFAAAGRIAHAAREVFGLTEAEANFADALCAGMSPRDYARERRVSLNTIYTHLRHIKSKTGSTRTPDLVRRLTALNPALRD